MSETKDTPESKEDFIERMAELEEKIAEVNRLKEQTVLDYQEYKKKAFLDTVREYSDLYQTYIKFDSMRAAKESEELELSKLQETAQLVREKIVNLTNECNTVSSLLRMALTGEIPDETLNEFLGVPVEVVTKVVKTEAGVKTRKAESGNPIIDGKEMNWIEALEIFKIPYGVKDSAHRNYKAAVVAGKAPLIPVRFKRGIVMQKLIEGKVVED